MTTIKKLRDSSTKRQAILEAAQSLLSRKNYEELTIADIAAQAGIAVGTIYLYFRNKRDIYTSASLSMDALIVEVCGDPRFLAMPIREGIPELVTSLFKVSREHMHLMALFQMDLQSGEEARQHQHSDQQIIEALDLLLRRAIERGELAPFPTEIYASMLNHIGGALLHQCFAVENGAREELYCNSLIDLLQHLFFGPSLAQRTEN